MDNFAQPVQKNIRHNSTELLPLPFRPRCSVGNSLRNHILLNLTACTFGIWRLARSAAQWSQITNLYSRILSSHARLGTSDPQQPKKINARIYNYIYIHTHSHTHTHTSWNNSRPGIDSWFWGMGFPRLLEIEVGNAQLVVQGVPVWQLCSTCSMCWFPGKETWSLWETQVHDAVAHLEHSSPIKAKSLKLQLAKSKQIIPTCSLFGWTKHSQQTEFRTWDCPFRAQLAKGILHSFSLARGNSVKYCHTALAFFGTEVADHNPSPGACHFQVRNSLYVCSSLSKLILHDLYQKKKADCFPYRSQAGSYPPEHPAKSWRAEVLVTWVACNPSSNAILYDSWFVWPALS